MQKFSLAPMLVAGAVVFGMNAHAIAQEAAQNPERGKSVEDRAKERGSSEDYKPRGATVGTFKLYPTLSVTEEYQTNIYAANSNIKDDWITIYTPSVKLNSDWNNHAINLSGKGEIVRYSSYDADNVENFDVVADGRIDVTRNLKLTAGASHGVGHEDRGSPNAVNGVNPTETDTQIFKIGVSYKPGRYSYSVDVNTRKKNYVDAVTSTGSVTNNDDRDRQRDKVTARAGFEYLPGTVAFVRASYYRIEYDVEAGQDDNGEDRDSKGYEIVVGSDLDFTGVVTGRAFAGYMRQNYDDNGLKSIKGPTVGASVRGELSSITSYRFSLDRSIQETTTARSSGYVSSNATVRLSHEFLRNLVGRVRAKASLSDYQGTARKDYTYTGCDLNRSTQHIR